MASIPGSQAKPTIEEVRKWGENKLLEWIRQDQPELLQGSRVEKFKEAAISGRVFVNHAGDINFFRNECNLPIGVSETLADLANELTGGGTAGMAQKRKEQDTSTGSQEQVESAEPSSKRRHIESKVRDKARNLRYHLLHKFLGPEMLRKHLFDPGPEERQRLEALRKQRLEELREQLTDPSRTTEFPFPFPGSGKPYERFAITSGEKWSYVGREYFTTLLNEVTQLMGPGIRELCLYGTIGYGKSHLLAALVCYLTAAGTRVVYIPDCRECCKRPIEYFRSAMLFTWADNMDVQNDIMKLRSMQDIEDFFLSEEEILFIVDQTNALDAEENLGDKSSNNKKQEVLEWIEACASQHKVIYSASANYQARLRTVQKQTNDKQLYVYGGLSDKEMEQWWIRNKDALPEEYKADNLDEDTASDRETFRSEVEDLTGRIPLLLNRSIVKGKINLSAPQLQKDFSQVQDFMLTIEKKHGEYWDLHCQYVTACIINDIPPLLSLPYIDHRYFYVDDNIGKYACGKYTCGIARQAAARRLREHKRTAFTSQESLNALKMYINNASVTGFFIEQAVLSSIIAHGLSIMGVNTHVKQRMFSGDYPKFDRSLEDWVLYCPLQFNCKTIDALLARFDNQSEEDNSRKKSTSRKKNNSNGNNTSGENGENDCSGERKKCYLYPIQVTVAKSHADSAESFFSHRRTWAQDLDDYDIKVEFCWITPDQEIRLTRVAKPSRSLRSSVISNGPYQVTHIPLEEVSQKIWSKYKEAKETPRWNYDYSWTSV